MTKGYQFICNQRDWCGMKEHDSHEHLGAEYVLASDYAALEAERDLLREDLDAAAGELLIPVPIPGSIESKMLIANRLLSAERDELKRRIEKIRDWINENNDDGLHLWLLAIAEGRDNG